MLKSMTGFARSQGQYEDCSWTWEIKSVNGKSLDMRSRFPHGFDSLDMPTRKAVSGAFKRGNFSLGLNLKQSQFSSKLRINQDILGQLGTLLGTLKSNVPDATPPSLDGLLNIKGAVEVEEQEVSEEFRAALEKEILESLSLVITGLAEMRTTEGVQMQVVLQGQLDSILNLCAQAEKLSVFQPEAIKEKLQGQVNELLVAVPPLSEDRLAQEAALLMIKADIREELDRLKAHSETAQELLNSDEPVGRRLDFLCQEFNREANTLCSKSSDVELTNIGMALKATIEQFREQVQNIE
ncbi:MAG: YicC family protein [Rhodospirillales bacterium]|nr:YicC family protein [Rhodospirillales bacterium]